MNRILSFLLSLSLFIPLLLIFSPQKAQAANPSASLGLTADKKYVNIYFSNLQDVTRITYTLTYQTGSRTTGFEGSLKPKPKTSRLSRRQILGTCSTRRCVFHPNPKNFNLEITFTTKSGQKITQTKTL